MVFKIKFDYTVSDPTENNMRYYVEALDFLKTLKPNIALKNVEAALKESLVKVSDKEFAE